MATHEIGTIEDFPEGKGTPVTVSGIQIAVFHVDGEIYAIGDNCPHKNLPLHPAGESRYISEEVKEKYGGDATRGDVDGETPSVRCPWHYMEWNLESGCNEATGMCIPTYDVSVDDGTVLVDI